MKAIKAISLIFYEMLQPTILLKRRLLYNNVTFASPSEI